MDNRALLAALQQKVVEQAQQLVNRAISDGSVLANTLHHLTEQANAGQTVSRDVLRRLIDNLDAARAAARGITVVGQPRSPVPPDAAVEDRGGG